MPTLREPQKQIPGGYQYYIPETGWKPAPFSSLDSIVTQLIEHRKGQPYLTAKNGWSLDRGQVLAEVTAYNVAVCVQMGYNDYLIGGSEAIVPFPHTLPNLLQKARRVAGGVETIVSWRVSDGAPTVSQELANKRASICTGGDDPQKKCPMNGVGGLEAYFTVPAARVIRAEVEHKKQMKLETPSDEHLGVCTACDCPLILKVWMPLDNILSKMPAEVQAKLHPNCWILKRDQ